jgi:hypothetical protein
VVKDLLEQGIVGDELLRIVELLTGLPALQGCSSSPANKA